eukprot:scaffold79438_cov34-Phaeocystis_antarctica.AAC.1
MGCKGVASERGLRAPFRSGARSAPTLSLRLPGGRRSNDSGRLNSGCKCGLVIWCDERRLLGRPGRPGAASRWTGGHAPPLHGVPVGQGQPAGPRRRCAVGRVRRGSRPA